MTRIVLCGLLAGLLTGAVLPAGAQEKQGKAKKAASPDDQYVPGPDSLEQPGVPKREVTRYSWNESKIYPGMVRDYWVYVPKQYDPAKPACVFVCQDRVLYNAPTVFDNLIHKSAQTRSASVLQRSAASRTSAAGTSTPSWCAARRKSRSGSSSRMVRTTSSTSSGAGRRPTRRWRRRWRRRGTTTNSCSGRGSTARSMGRRCFPRRCGGSGGMIRESERGVPSGIESAIKRPCAGARSRCQRTYRGRRTAPSRCLVAASRPRCRVRRGAPEARKLATS